jgi:hypothetical protein
MGPLQQLPPHVVHSAATQQFLTQRPTAAKSARKTMAEGGGGGGYKCTAEEELVVLHHRSRPVLSTLLSEDFLSLRLLCIVLRILIHV